MTDPRIAHARLIRKAARKGAFKVYGALTVVAALLLLVAIGRLLAPEPDSVPEAGVYTGTVKIERATGATDTYPLVFTFAPDGVGYDIGDGRCVGTLTDHGSAGDGRNYQLAITSGECAGGGVWKVEVLSSSRISATSEGAEPAEATLRKR